MSTGDGGERFAKVVATGVVLAVVVVALVFFGLAIAADHWLFHPLGGRGYQFWSGIAGSFILGSGIWAGVAHAYRRHNCHARWCWRVGKYAVAGTSYVVCRRHQPETPDRPATAEHIRAAHHKAMARRLEH